MNPYVPVIVMIVIAALLAGAGLLVSRIVGPRHYNAAKLDRYESGLEPTPGAAGGGRVPIKYYLVAMTFIVFDIEVVFLYQWAVNFSELALFGFVATMLFLVVITVPYLYEWRRGGFEWA